MMLIASFLPLYESPGLINNIKENSLIQHGGWTLIAAAIVIAAAGFAARNGKGWPSVLVIAALAAIGLGIFVSDKDNHTLYPISADGSVDSSGNGTVVDFGTGIYAAFVGVALAAAGALMLRKAEEDAGSKKKCPECAELVQPDALVCRHCGYRFESAERPEVETRKVRCFKCSHVQEIWADATVVPCIECGTQMKVRHKTPRGSPD